MRVALLSAANAVDIGLEQIVYAWFSGPSFETQTEIRAVLAPGADTVGLSTESEGFLSLFPELKVTAGSVITNMASGLFNEETTHEHTKAIAALGALKPERVLRSYLSSGLF